MNFESITTLSAKEQSKIIGGYGTTVPKRCHTPPLYKCKVPGGYAYGGQTTADPANCPLFSIAEPQPVIYYNC